MKLEVTLCYSVLEYCLRNSNLWERNNDANKLREEIMRRRIVVHPELLSVWEKHFDNCCSDLKDDFMQFLNTTVIYEEHCKLVDDYEISKIIDYLFAEDDMDKRLLYNICNSTEDKILFTEIMDDICRDPRCEVNIFNVQRIVNDTEDHELNRYRLPFANRPIRLGDSSLELSRNLKKYVVKEQELIICDNYIWTSRNSYNLYKYLLNHLPLGANIKIYTTDQADRISEKKIVKVFSNHRFSNWNFEIFLVHDKKKNHARKIITSKYIINLEKGLASFGTGPYDRTDETLLSVSYKTEPIQLPQSRQIL